MHKDQARVRDALLPSVFDRVYGSDAASERDCTVLNRTFLQGPDPLFLMEACPKEFVRLCGLLGLDVAEGRDAIEQAHWRGPGILLDENMGIPFGYLHQSIEDMSWASKAWRREAVWLFLAGVSDTTEEDYKLEVTLLARLQRAVGAGLSMARLLDHPQITPWVAAADTLQKFNDSTVLRVGLVGQPAKFPWSCEDHGFYIAFKRGYKAAGVRHGDKLFIGTTPDTTLEERGLHVDVKVSESYGFVRVS